MLVEALHKISNPFDHGHCGTCGKECAGATDCDCSFPVWEQDNPIAIAKAALSHAPFQPAPVVESANVKLLREATLLLQNVEDSFPMNAELPGWLRDCRKRIEAIASSPQPDRESERDYEEIAGRIWDAWQNSPTCTDQWRGISWTNICQSRKTNAAAQACYETGMAEARAAFRFEFTSSNRPQATEEGK